MFNMKQNNKCFNQFLNLKSCEILIFEFRDI